MTFQANPMFLESKSSFCENLFIYLFICLFVCLFVCLFIYLFIYLFIACSSIDILMYIT